MPWCEGWLVVAEGGEFGDGDDVGGAAGAADGVVVVPDADAFAAVAGYSDVMFGEIGRTGMVI